MPCGLHVVSRVWGPCGDDVGTMRTMWGQHGDDRDVQRPHRDQGGQQITKNARTLE